MKQYLSLFLATIMIIGTSCNSNTKSEKLTDFDNLPTEYKDLLSELDSYNTTLGFDSRLTSRGWLSRFLTATFCCDAFGFALGYGGGPAMGLVIGILYSALNVPGSIIWTDDGMSTPSVDTKSVTPPYQLSINRPEDLGLIHNLILLDMYQEDSSFLTTLDNEQLYQRIKEKLIFHYPQVDNQFDVTSGSELYQVACDMEGLDADTMYNLIVDMIPENENDMQVIHYYCETLADCSDLTDEQIADLTERYYRIINLSDIPEGSKNFIKASISVAENSERLWAD